MNMMQECSVIRSNTEWDPAEEECTLSLPIGTIMPQAINLGGLMSLSPSVETISNISNTRLVRFTRLESLASLFKVYLFNYEYPERVYS